MYMNLYARDVSPTLQLFMIVISLLSFFYIAGNILGVSKIPQYEVVTPIIVNNVLEDGIVDGE